MTSRIRTLIVDDEPAARAAIRTLLAADPEIEIVGEAADGGSALEAMHAAVPDLVFLDVQMPGLDGFAVLRQLDPSEQPEVVFVTAYDAYALQAFDVHALDYVLKPFDDERFRMALARAKQQVRQGKFGALTQQLLALLQEGAAGAASAETRYLRRLVLKSGGRVTLLDTEEIDWIEAAGDYVKLHVGKSWHLLRATMKTMESQFDPARFARIHRSTIVNLSRIKELQPYFKGEYVVLLHDGTSLKLARGYKDQFETRLGGTF